MFATFNGLPYTKYAKLFMNTKSKRDETLNAKVLSPSSLSPSPLSADALKLALMVSGADNPSHLKGARHWQSDLNGFWLKQMLKVSHTQSTLLRPFGIPSSLFTGWVHPLVEATRKAVAEGQNPDLVARDDERIDSTYAAELKALVRQFTQPVLGESGQEKTDQNTTRAFNPETCRWACETLQGQSWLLSQLQQFRQLEWQYHSQGKTHLAALKDLLSSLFQVITSEVFSNPEDQPYRKTQPDGQWRDSDAEYLQACSDRLLALLEHDAFDVRRFALSSPHAVLGASQWQTVPGSELYSVKLRHYPRPEGVKANGKTLYLASPMINRCELFDLAPGKSVIEGMLKLGYDLYLVDYGNPEADQCELSLDFYGKTIHDTYLDLILERHPEQNIEVMAYCMGGTLFMPYLARRIEEAQITGKDVRIRQVVLMTSPILFDDDESGHKPMRDVIRQDYDADLMTLFFGQCNVAPQTLELGMHAIQPGVDQSVLEGFYARANFPDAVQDAAPFLKWLHSGTRFPARSHKEWISNVFIGNQIWEGEYCLSSDLPELDGKPVNMDVLNSADIALFDYCGQRDPIAPVGSCKTSERWGRRDNNHRMVRSGLNRTIEKNIGHIFVVSHKLLDEFLDAVTDFLADEPPAYQGKKAPATKVKTAVAKAKTTTRKTTTKAAAAPTKTVSTRKPAVRKTAASTPKAAAKTTAPAKAVTETTNSAAVEPATKTTQAKVAEPAASKTTPLAEAKTTAPAVKAEAETEMAKTNSTAVDKKDQV